MRTYKAICEVCGCEGVSPNNIPRFNYIKGVEIRHSDPKVCEKNLQLKNKKK